MGGLQQIDKLFRKNLLLKARRPKATCFELVLPLVLFAILAIMRKEYDNNIMYFPGARFKNQPIFPQTRRLVELVEGTGEDTPAVADALRTRLACDPSITAWAEDALEPVLAFSLGNGSLADEVLSLDVANTSGLALRLLHSIEEADVGELVGFVESGRREYLGSQWARQLEASAQHADGELSMLQAELHSNGTEDARSRVQGWLHDACQLQGPVFDQWNTSELARDLASLRRALDESGIMGLLSDARDALDSVAPLGGLLNDTVNGSLAMTWLDKALDELGPSELKAWLVDVRNAMDMQRSVGWLNKTLDAIDSSEVKTWLIQLRDLLDSSQPMSWLNMTLSETDTSEGRAWLLHRLHDLMNATLPLSFNRTIDEVDSLALRNVLRDRLDELAQAMNVTLPSHSLDGAPSTSMQADLELVMRLWQMANGTTTLGMVAGVQWPARALDDSLRSWASPLQEMIWWTSHFARSESPFSPVLQLGHDLAGLVSTDANATLEARLLVQLPRLSRSMESIGAALRAAGDALHGEGNRTFPELERQLNESSRVVSRLSSLLREVNSSQSLHEMVYEALGQLSSNTSLQRVMHDAVGLANLTGSLREEVDEALRRAEFGGSLGREVVEALRRMNFSGELREEVHASLQRANFSGALRMEMRTALRMANLSESMSGEVADALLQVNLSNALRLELADVLSRSNLASSFDAQVMEVLHEARSSLRDLDGYVAAWRQQLDELFGQGSGASGRPVTSLLEAITNLTGLNATQIEQDVLPAWKGHWRAHCLEINSSKVGDLFVRMQQRCPFYRSKMEAAADLNLTQTVRGWHAELQRLNASRLQEGLEDAQSELRRLNASRLEGSLQRVLLQAQELYRQRPDDLEWSGWSTPQRVAHTLTRALKEEFLGNASSASCSAPRQGNAMLDWLVGYDSEPNGGPETSRRLSHQGSSAQQFLERELMRRKLLIAPYKGEVRELWDLVMVEFVLLLTTTEHGGVPNRLMEALLRCPVLRGVLASRAKSFLEERTLTFDTEAELERFAIDRPDDVFAALVFRGADEATGNFGAERLDVTYAVRFHATLLPSTERVISVVSFGMFGGISMSESAYLSIGFAYLQETVGRATARLRARRESLATAAVRNTTDSEISHNLWAHNATAAIRRLAIGAEPFPTPGYKVDAFIYAIQYMLPMFMIMGWIYCVSLLVKEMVYEKQEKLREVMRIQGLRTWVYWLSWTTFAMAQLSLLVVAMTLLICGGNVLKYSDPVLIFLFFIIYSGAVVSFAMLVSACFSRAKVAAVCAGVAYYSLYLPVTIYTRFEETSSLAFKCAFCLMCPSGLGVGVSLIAKWELLEEGLQWRNLALPPPVTNTGSVPNTDFSVAHVTAMLFVDMALYQVLAWYIEKVFPGELGLPQPWYFPLLPSYWRGGSDAGKASQSQDGNGQEKDDNPRLECYEAAPLGLTAAVQIRRLAKTFRGGKRALRGVSLDLHSGTITGLLGHNGAGKSTTMSILTGLYPPSTGDVLVNGCSVRRDSGSVRKQLGVCLQHNALYDALTVQEHLDLFCNLKSVPRSQVAAEVNILLRDTGLEPKRNAPSRALSGGMKRKLSIGIALAGGSKVIALDEPTAGVDATSRRDIWQLLAAHKKGRAILLSTHFMDEADVLSDRIAIIAEGQLTAIGSSVGLKKHFADRYLLTIVASDRADASLLLAAVRAVVPEASCVGTRGREFSYTLPSSARPRFAGLFNSLQDEEARSRLGVETYGLSAATMEEVFLMASSVHEEGLHGVVRNGGDDTASDDVSTTSGGGSSRPHTASVAASRPGTPPTPRSNEKEATPGSNAISDGGSSHSREETLEVIEPPPFSPQCISAIEPTQTVKQVLPDVDNALKHTADDFMSVGSLDSGARQLLRGPPLLWQQFRARLWARAKSARRDRNAWASQILLPVCFVLLALVMAWLLQTEEEEPPLKLTTDMFIGTVAGGRASLDQHTIPFSDARGDAFGSDVHSAFSAAKGEDDVLLQVDPRLRNGSDGTWGLRRYIMTNKKELRSKAYSAVSVAGHSETANLTLWYENRAKHIIPAMVHMCNNARLNLLGYSDTRTETWNHPLPKTQQLLEQEMSGNGRIFTSLTVAVTTLLAFGFIPASFLVYLVHEKATNGKHQQLLTGVSPVMYWVSSYCWDLINCCIAVACIFLIFIVFQLDAYSGPHAPALLMLFLSYCAAMTPQMYCLEPLFKVPSTAYVTCIVLNIFTGTVSVMTTTVLGLYESEIPKLRAINKLLTTIFPWLLPNYNLGRGMMEIATNHYMRFAAEEFGACEALDPSACGGDSLDWDVAGQFIFYLLVMSGVWFLLRLLIEWRCFRGLFCAAGRHAPAPKSGKEDAAVLEEAARVHTSLQGAGKDAGSLVICDLSKSFTRARWSGCRRHMEAVHSVKGLSVAVGGGECFGLLGVNGAGKTTTMRMITGDIEVGGGDVLLSGWSIRKHRDMARQHLGYCPQFDALSDKLTTREAISFYARIRGVPPQSVHDVVQAMIRRMCLEAHQDRLCQHLSGGNKRKLSTALALIGEPDVVLLDEPSTGVDVGARRFLWDVLGQIRQRGQALVLTSHSMDECEVLCTRLTIMVSGEMRCLGTPLQLKAKYGGGYTLAVKAQQPASAAEDSAGEATEVNKPSRDPSSSIRGFMEDKVPTARLAEENVGLFRYRLGNDAAGGQAEQQEAPLAEVFGELEAAMRVGGALEACVLDYTISQTSLEEVFLHFSR